MDKRRRKNYFISGVTPQYFSTSPFLGSNIPTFLSPKAFVENESYLLLRKKFKKSRKELMFEMESLGHGYDDPQGANFTAMMGEYFKDFKEEFIANQTWSELGRPTLTIETFRK